MNMFDEVKLEQIQEDLDIFMYAQKGVDMQLIEVNMRIRKNDKDSLIWIAKNEKERLEKLTSALEKRIYLKVGELKVERERGILKLQE